MSTPPATRSPRWLLPVAVLMALLLVTTGGALAVITGVGRTDAPAEGSVDVGFARDMSTHHTQAVSMAGVARDSSDEVDVRVLAFDIETNQNQQVGMMRGWLQVWERPVNGIAEPMAWMGGDHSMQMSGGLMPGLVNGDELDALRAASGSELDVLFLQLMIRHHQGGVEMARYAALNAATAPVRTLAESMVTTQSAEIANMRVMLTERGGTELPFP